MARARGPGPERGRLSRGRRREPVAIAQSPSRLLELDVAYSDSQCQKTLSRPVPSHPGFSLTRSIRRPILRACFHLAGPMWMNDWLARRTRNVNKGELIEAVAAATNNSKAEAARAVDAVLGAVTQGLKSSGQVQLAGFGSFKVVQRAARTGRNPRTGEPMQIAASKGVKFTPSKSIKSEL